MRCASDQTERSSRGASPTKGTPLMSGIQIAAFSALTTLAALHVQAFAQGLDQPAKAIPCPDIVTQTVMETEGETFVCGVVTVPADYDAPEGARIDLMYGILRSTSLSPASDPVIYLHGGPGGGELGSMTSDLAHRLATLRARRDIIVFDQRGSGFSPGEIECNDIFAANNDAAYEAAEGIAEASGMNLGAAASEYLIPLCTAQLIARGVDLSQYNTVNNARDVISLAAALGFESYNIYGHSYGTRLGLEVLRQSPAALRPFCSTRFCRRTSRGESACRKPTKKHSWVYTGCALRTRLAPRRIPTLSPL